MKFDIGDRVIAIMDYGAVKKNHLGTYVGKGRTYMVEADAAVEWDCSHRDMHSCNGRTKSKHGWYIPESRIEHCEAIDLGELPGAEYGSESILFGL